VAKRNRVIEALAASLLVVVATTALAADRAALFPRPADLEPAVRFWTRVYTEVGTDGGFVHDSEHLDVVYDVIHFADGASRRERRRQVDHAFDKYKAILTTLAKGKREHLNREERKVLSLWPDDVSNTELKAASRRLRFQLGQADRFRAGLIRSGAWRAYIEKVLDEHGLPLELAALPHVESSFDPTAYSKVGAAGLWQFTRSTGLRYMRIDHVVDERRDPFLSTRAAARLLEDNYAVLQSWPLAITAYNHGLAGMRRAVSEQKTTDIDVILHDYRSRTFGFASRNFYVAFLAALDVDADAERYFGSLRLDPPAKLAVVDVPDYVESGTLTKLFNVRESTLRAYNPALMPSVWNGDKFVPKGFMLRLPATPENPARLVASIPSGERYVAQRPDVYHRVRRGDTLSQIAQQYRVSVRALAQMNGLRSRDFIRAGQLLTLPVANSSGDPPTLASAESAAATTDDGIYIVRRGDSVDRIARRFGIDEDALLAENDIHDKHLIYVGQQLRIVPAVARTTSRSTHQVDAGTGVVETSGSPLPSSASLAAAADSQDRSDVGAASTESTEEADDAEADSNALESVQADLAADPSDYSVAANGTIEVQALETLGHYADWLQIRTQRLRDLNHLPFGQAVVIGQHLKLDFSRVGVTEFEKRRLSHQAATQEAFFRAHRIEDIRDHVIKPGESVWILALRQYRVPVWLLRQYNPDLDLAHVRPGTVVKFPRFKRVAEADSPQEGVSI
jgi:membrane-bound lytic murein transglycosylase D